MAEITEALTCRFFHGTTRGIIWPCEPTVNKSSFTKEINTFSLNYASCQGGDIITSPGVSILLSWHLKYISCFARLFRNLRSKPQNLNIVTSTFCWVFAVLSPDNINTKQPTLCFTSPNVFRIRCKPCVSFIFMGFR